MNSDLCTECGLWYYPGKNGKNINFHICIGKITNIKGCTCSSCECGMTSCWKCSHGIVPKDYIPCVIHKKCLNCGSESVDNNGKYVGPLCKENLCYWCRTLYKRG